MRRRFQECSVRPGRMLPLRPAGILILLLVWGGATTQGADRLIFEQIPVRAVGESAAAPVDGGVGVDLPMGSRIVGFDPARPTDDVEILTPDFAAAGRPDLSFDGKRVLFIGKRKPADAFHVWEMNAEGGDLRLVTHAVGQVRAAIYLSTIYTMDADRPVYQIALSGVCETDVGRVLHTEAHVGERRAEPDPHLCLYTCWMDGTHIRRITFGPSGAGDPYLLSDGRLLFSRQPSAVSRQPSAVSRQPSAVGVHNPQTTIRNPQSTTTTDLLTVNTDGTDVFVFAAVHEPPAVRSMPCETPDGWVVYVESALDTVDRGGSLVAVARTRSLHTRRVVAADPDGLYHSPFVMGDGKLLVSYRSKAGGSYGIYMLDPSNGTRVARVFDDPQWHEVDTVVVKPRPIPAGRSSVVDEGGEYGFLYCMNAYLSDREEAKAIGPGRIKRLQVFTATTAEELLGEVPVEPDGSFFLKVPARTPLRLQTLDADGEILQAMHSWIWVMPKEARGCIGCHEDRELTPPNRHVLALWKAPRAVGVKASPSK